MAMNKLYKERISKKIVCYQLNRKKEQTYMIVFNNESGFLIRRNKKTKESAFIMSSEKRFLLLPKTTKGVTKIPFKKCISKILKDVSKFPDPRPDVLGFMMVCVEEMLEKIPQVVNKRKTNQITSHTCCGG